MHPRAKTSLEDWYDTVKLVDWETFQDVKSHYNHADRFDRFVIFDIAGNRYRLIASIHYNCGRLYVRNILTHAEYIRGKWKEL